MYRYLLILCICIYFLCTYQKSIEQATFKNEKGIDAIINIGNSYIYIFRNKLCSKYSLKTKPPLQLLPGYPKNISHEFSGIPNNIKTAALVKKNLILFMKDNQSYLFDIEKQVIKNGYPKKNTSIDPFLETIDSFVRTTTN